MPKLPSASLTEVLHGSQAKPGLPGRRWRAFVFGAAWAKNSIGAAHRHARFRTWAERAGSGHKCDRGYCTEGSVCLCTYDRLRSAPCPHARPALAPTLWAKKQTKMVYLTHRFSCLERQLLSLAGHSAPKRRAQVPAGRQRWACRDTTTVGMLEV